MSRGAPPRVAVFGIGLAAYWPQFDGLRQRLEQYQRGIERRLEEMGAEVVSAGLVDTPQAARAAGEALAAGRPRSPARLHGDLRDLVTGPPRRPGGRRAGRRPQPSTDAHGRLRGDDDGRVARQLLGVLCPRDRGRTDTGGDSLQDRHGDAARRRPGMERPAANGWTRPAPCTTSEPRVSASSATRTPECSTCTPTSHRCTPRPVRTSRCSRSTISSLVSSRRTRGAIDQQERRDPRGLRPGRRRLRPDRRGDHARGLRVVGARRRRPRPARRGFRARRAHLLLPRCRRQHRRASELGSHRRQLPAHRTRRPDRRRRRPQDQHRDALARPARSRRVVHRVLRPRLRRAVHPHGPRRPRATSRSPTDDPSRARSGCTTGRRARDSR